MNARIFFLFIVCKLLILTAVGGKFMGGGLYLLSNREKIRIQYYKHFSDDISDIQTTAGFKGRFCKVKINT